MITSFILVMCSLQRLYTGSERERSAERVRLPAAVFEVVKRLPCIIILTFTSQVFPINVRQQQRWSASHSARKPRGNKISESRVESMTYWSLISEASASALPMRRIAAQLSLEKWNSKLKIINTFITSLLMNQLFWTCSLNERFNDSLKARCRNNVRAEWKPFNAHIDAV